ncbi:MAG TPA: hypothetical protein VFW38_07675 [Solirubrobacteraceae bacterium]|nr:hypothetical protein [Solirubrobacteraceae bacterium]
MAHKHTSSPSQTRPAYAGIGSRATPPAVLDLMVRAASWLSAQGWVLRTGMATGADQAFYRGAHTHGTLELYLPWPTFESAARTLRCGSEQFVLGKPTPAAYELAARFHPAWSRLTRAVRALHARNAHQVLGADLASPARFVLCWTPDGSLDGRGQRVGGTGQALRIAHHHGIAIFNLARPEHLQRLSPHCTDAPR